MSQIINVNVTPASYGLDIEGIKAAVGQVAELTIAGVDDKEGFERVRRARLDLKKVRCEIEKKRKELKADAVEFGRRVDAAAKELTALVEPTEQLLLGREESIEKEIAAIAARKLQGRKDRLTEAGALIFPGLDKIADDEFEELVTAAQLAHQKRQQQEAEAAQARKLEEERLAKEREELARQRKQQEAERIQMLARIEAQQKELELNRAVPLPPEIEQIAPAGAATTFREDTDQKKLQSVVSAMMSIEIPAFSIPGVQQNLIREIKEMANYIQTTYTNKYFERLEGEGK
jgi:hypothetical protein